MLSKFCIFGSKRAINMATSLPECTKFVISYSSGADRGGGGGGGGGGEGGVGVSIPLFVQNNSPPPTAKNFTF